MANDDEKLRALMAEGLQMTDEQVKEFLDSLLMCKRCGQPKTAHTPWPQEKCLFGPTTFKLDRTRSDTEY